MGRILQPVNPIPTERFQRVLAFASDEADGLGHGFVSCQHILYALSRETKGLAGSVLEEFGLTPQKLHEHLAESAASHDRTPDAIIDLSDEARDLVQRAVDIARVWNHRALDTEHLLYGILSAPTSADEMFAAYHAPPTALLERLTTLQQSAPQAVIRDEAAHAYRLSLESAWLLSYAMDEGRKCGAHQISSLHLLAAMTRMPGKLQDFLGQSLNVTDLQLSRYLALGEGAKTSLRLPLADDMQRILGRAIGEAWNRGHLSVTPLHLAMGIARSEQSIALDTLAELGISRSDFEDALETLMPPAVSR